jgi:two-component sensor histidine kinase
LATGLGLLVAELVTNTFKYAYPAGKRRSVYVDFKETRDGWRLVVSDEGRGLPEGCDIDQSRGFGMKVVKAFVSLLNAKLTVTSRSGFTR